MKISVDFAHCLSGYDTGASGCGYKEEVLTRVVGKLVVNKLRSLGHTVLAVDLERSHSVNSSLSYRKDAINTFKPDLSISIHFNAGGGIGGIEIYTDGYCNNEATRVINNFVAMGYSNRGIKDGMQLALVGGINHYAMLIECCFINIQGDMDKYNAEKFANNIVNGILDIKLVEEVIKIDNAVIFTRGNEADRGLAIFYKATVNECAIFDTSEKVDYAKFKKVVAIGGNKNSYTSYLKDENFIAGKDRYETNEKLVAFMQKM